MGAEPDPVESAEDGAVPVWTGDPLFALLDELRGEGFHIGVGEYLEAQAAAAACHRDGLGHDPRRLRNYLAPVLCTTPEQQQLFYRRFDAWWLDRAGGQQEELPPPPLPPPPLGESELGKAVRRTRPWKWWALSALGTAALVAALVWWSGHGVEAGGAGPMVLPETVQQPEPVPTQPITSTRTGEVRLAVRLRRLTVNAQVTDLAGRPLPGTMVRRHSGGELIATLRGHTHAINSASFSADGIRVVTASDDNTARVWSPGKDGTWPSIALEGHQGRVNWASFSPDGARIVTASDDNTARVWSRGQDGAWRSVALAGHRDRVTSASFSPDGAHIVTSSDDRTARVWGQGGDGTWHSVGLAGPKGRVISAVFSPDGSSILTASQDGWAQLWAAGGSSEIAHLRVDRLSATAFSPDGKHIVLASCHGTTAQVWDVETKIVVELKPYDLCAIAASFSPDSRRVITASSEAAQIWDAATGEALGKPVPFRVRVMFASLSPNGTRAVTASKGSEARIWSAFPPSNPLTLPVLGTSDEKGGIGLSLNQVSRTQTLYFSHSGYQPPPPFILPANTVRGAALDVKLAPLTVWERLSNHQRKVQAGLVLLPMVLTGPWLAWRVLRRRQLVLERRTTPEEQAVASPSLPEPQHDLYRGTGFARARVEVQRRQRTGAGDLDPDATVEATMRNLGFFTPVYRSRLELPVYLVLIDRIGLRDQRARMVDELLDRLQAGGVALVRYDFDRDPRRASLRSSGGAHRDLEELAGLYPGHRLAVFTDGAGFTEPATGRLAAWSELFSAWPERAFLTPVPLDRWSRRELDLAAAGFAVLPASEAGIERLADMFRRAEGVVPRPMEETWSPPYPDLLAARPGRFLERHAPEESEQSALCGELAFYLGPDGYRWLCSLAVYPELDWYFTLYLGLLLRRFDGRKVLAETTLLALTRLPWLRHGSMPDWLRLRLLRDLSENDEKEVRDWMRQFLEQREIPGSRFRLDVARPQEPAARGLRNRLRRWVESKDWRRLIKDWAHREPQEGALRDQIFVSFLLGTKPSRLQVVAPSAWRRLVWVHGTPALGPRTNSVLLLTVLLAVLGFALGGPPLEWMARQTPAERSTIAAKLLDSLHVTLSFSGDSWIAVAIDGQPRTAELRVAGESMSFEAEREVRLTIGNPPVTQVTVNGYPMKLNSSAGRVIKDLVIDADTVKSLAGVAQQTGG